MGERIGGCMVYVWVGGVREMKYVCVCLMLSKF